MPDSGLRMELVFKLKRVNENNYEKGNNYMEKLRKEIETYLPFNEQEEQDQRQFLRLLEHMPDLLTRENDVAHITVSAWIVNLDRTKVLMAYHNIYQSWAWLGGHADGNPDVRQVIRKEIEEESGLTDIRFLTDDIFSLESLTVDGHEKRGTYISSHLHLNLTFLLEADEHLPLRIKPDETARSDGSTYLRLQKNLRKNGSSIEFTSSFVKKFSGIFLPENIIKHTRTGIRLFTKKEPVGSAIRPLQS